MKGTVNHRWPIVLAWLGIAMATCDAQTFTTIRSFGILTNVTGSRPASPLVQGPDGTLYGTCSDGEGSVGGTVFKMQADGTGFTVLKMFTNSVDGYVPQAGVTLSGSVLYGTTSYGGTADSGTVFADSGTVFRMNTDGTGYSVLHSFTGGLDGFYPVAVLALSGGVLYGTTSHGGSTHNGTVFKINTDGTGYSVLHNFGDPSDGAPPSAGLTLSGSVLYGTASGGGISNNGTLFRMNTDGTGYRVLYNFTNAPDGNDPAGGLTLSGSVLYGTTVKGGSSGNGTVFSINTDGTGYSVLYSFTATSWPSYDNSDGAQPQGGLVLSSNTLYGTASAGGSSAFGTVFSINTDGTGFSALYTFTFSADGARPFGGLTVSGSVLYGTAQIGGSLLGGTVFSINTDGTGYNVLKNLVLASGDAVNPQAGLTLSGSLLYGTTLRGGSSRHGTVFSVGTDGTGYSVLYSFAGPPDGAWVSAGVTLSGSVLYGTTWAGGSSGNGTVFSINTDGTGYSVLYNFAGSPDGATPYAGLTLSGNVLYGTTCGGGSSGNAGNGTVFTINSDGTGYAVLKNFAGRDGANPWADLTLSGGVLYGTTVSGGSSDNGTVFKINTDGTGYAVLRSLGGSYGANPGGLTLSGSVLYGTASGGGISNNGTLFKLNTNGTGFTVLKYFDGTSGANPGGSLTLVGGALYGTAGGGSSGTVFSINTDGTGYTVVHNFVGAPDGASPSGGLTLSGNSLYGTAYSGGILGEGTVYSLSFPPLLSIATSGTNVVLAWPTNFAGFDYSGYTLQSTMNLAPPSVWVTNSVPPVVVNGQFTVTNPVSGGLQFFRLSQ
jgi:uncharacterized repeat protein (TIGR03803 family)